jgi:chorismate mutase/prephenate dehydratase
MAESGRSTPDAKTPTPELDELRVRIDAVDRVILEALNRRAQLVREVGSLKGRSGAPVYEAGRERQIVEQLERENTGPFPHAGLGPVFREIISATRSLEEPLSVAYLGPEGTFSHLAARRQFGALVGLRALPSIADVFGAVERGKADLAVVPIENTTEGIVTSTFDALAQHDVRICGESLLPVSLVLLSRSGRLEDVRRVASHPQPLAQCRRWLERNLPDAERVETPSTALAARQALRDGDVAAIGSAIAAEVYGLRIVESSIEDRSDNTTRFLLIARDAEPAPSGRDLTSVLFTLRQDEPGALHQLLAPFARHGVNLTSIQLRPMQGRSWEYLFFLDLEGHCSEARVADALREASGVALSHRVLGSFPRARRDGEAG